MNLEQRITGFASANKQKFKSRNEAYNAFLASHGMQDSPEARLSYKQFVETAKTSGSLDKMLIEKKAPLPKVDEVHLNAAGDKKKFTISTKAIVGIVLVVGVVSTLIYIGTRKTKTTGS